MVVGGSVDRTVLPFSLIPSADGAHSEVDVGHPEIAIRVNREGINSRIEDTIVGKCLAAVDHLFRNHMRGCRISSRAGIDRADTAADQRIGVGRSSAGSGVVADLSLLTTGRTRYRDRRSGDRLIECGHPVRDGFSVDIGEIGSGGGYCREDFPAMAPPRWRLR